MLLSMGSQRVGQDLTTEQQLNPSDVRTTEKVGFEADRIVSALWEFKVMENSRCWGEGEGNTCRDRYQKTPRSTFHYTVLVDQHPRGVWEVWARAEGAGGDARQSVAKQGPHPSSEVRRPSLCSPDSEAYDLDLHQAGRGSAHNEVVGITLGCPRLCSQREHLHQELFKERDSTSNYWQ